MLDWDDLRHFLAVAETGSTLAAGRRLRVSQTTCARRVAALEDRLRLSLFERRRQGYALTPAGEALVAQARSVEQAAHGFVDAAGALARDRGGVVRLTTGEIYAVTVLQPILRDLHAAHPDVTIEIDTTDELRDLSTGVADVALRTCERPQGAGLVARRVADDRWTVYCSRGYAATHGRPTRRAELAGHAFVGGGEPGLWRMYRAWLAENGLEDAVVLRHATATGLLAGARSGLGLAVLPSLVADRDPDLLRCLPAIRHSERGLWLLTPERLRHTPRVRLVLDFLADRLAALARDGADGRPLAHKGGEAPTPPHPSPL